MVVQIITRVELNPETEDEVLDKYSKDDKWKRVNNNTDVVIFESVPHRYKSEPKYIPGTIN